MLRILWTTGKISHILIVISLFLGNMGVTGSKYLLVEVKSKGASGDAKSKLIIICRKEVHHLFGICIEFYSNAIINVLKHLKYYCS